MISDSDNAMNKIKRVTIESDRGDLYKQVIRQGDTEAKWAKQRE
jgi:hypothetical protein